MNICENVNRGNRLAFGHTGMYCDVEGINGICLFPEEYMEWGGLLGAGIQPIPFP